MLGAEEPVSFGALLREHRLAARLTQEELAGRCGLGARTIQNLERGANLPRRETLVRLAASLGLVGDARVRFEATAKSLPRGPRAAPIHVAREAGSSLPGVVRLPDRRLAATPTRPPPNGDPAKPLSSFGELNVPNNLPVQRTSFIGREDSLDEVRRLLRSNHLVTLTGAGGCGKTRLALEVTRHLEADYPDGIWLVELAPVADPAQIGPTTALATGARAAPGRPIVRILVERLRAEQVLLIFDNCEHLIAGAAELVDALLRACPRLTVLATSREALRIPGEVDWRVPSLCLAPPHPGSEGRGAGGSEVSGGPLPASVSDPSATRPSDPGWVEEVGRAEAVRLFVERARAVQMDFAVTGRNAPTVAQICRRLDGIPLAIELAARRVKALSVGQIAARLDDRFRLLTVGSRTALPRQQTLQATVDWSYNLLAEPERALFNRLSVFTGAFTLDAVEAICGSVRAPDQAMGASPRDGRFPTPGTQNPTRTEADNVLELLGALVDKSLVIADRGLGGVESYRLLETLRQYGRERLVLTGEADNLHRRHASYYLRLAEDAHPHLYQPDELIYLARLDLEWDNVVAAMHWYLDHGGAEEGLRLAAALEFPMWYRGIDNLEGNAWRARLLEMPGERTPSPARANAVLWMGSVAWCVGDVAGARRWSREALAMTRHLGDDRALAWTMHRVSRFSGPEPERWYGASDWELAEGALGHYRAAADRWGTAVALAWLGNLAYQRRDSNRARQLFTEALAMARSVGERHCVAFTLRYFGEATSAENESEARAYLVESQRLYRELGDLQGPAFDEYFLGRLECLHGRYTAARPHYCVAVRPFADWMWVEMVVRSLQGLAIVATGQRQPERAARLVGASARLRDNASVPVSPVEQAELDTAFATARQEFVEAEFAAAWAEGQAMTLEQAVAYALVADDA